MTDTPEGPAVVVPTPERKAFVRGAAWQASQVLAVLEPFARKADSVSLSDALGHIERAHLMAARDLVAQLRAGSEDERPRNAAADTIASLCQERDDLVEHCNLRDKQMEAVKRERDEARRSYCKAADERNAAERLADRYKALAEGERERIATMFENIEEKWAARHVRRFSAPPLPKEPQPTDKEPSDV